jgi:hypothetical protein
MNFASLAQMMSAGCEKQTRFLRVLVATVIHPGRTPVSFDFELEGITLGTTIRAHRHVQYSSFSSAFMSLYDIML